MSEQHHTPTAAPGSGDDCHPAGLEFDGQAGAALHHHRRRMGLTATEVARRVGISQRRMSRLELGLEPLTLRLAIGLGAVLGMPAGWFLGLDAASVPAAISVRVEAVHEHWARMLTMRLASTGEMPH